MWLEDIFCSSVLGLSIVLAAAYGRKRKLNKVHCIKIYFTGFACDVKSKALYLVLAPIDFFHIFFQSFSFSM